MRLPVRRESNAGSQPLQPAGAFDRREIFSKFISNLESSSFISARTRMIILHNGISRKLLVGNAAKGRKGVENSCLKNDTYVYLKIIDATLSAVFSHPIS